MFKQKSKHHKTPLTIGVFGDIIGKRFKMNFFIDLDDTLYDTSSVLKGKTVADLLVAELHAPIFENAKKIIEQFNERGHACIVTTTRGLISIDEIQITKQRLKVEGFINKTKSLFLGFIPCVENKFEAIVYFYKNYYKQENIDNKNTILIDNDIDQILYAAMNGITTIFFAPNMDITDDEVKMMIDKLNIAVAHSWLDIEEIVNNKMLELN